MHKTARRVLIPLDIHLKLLIDKMGAAEESIVTEAVKIYYTCLHLDDLT